MMNKIQAKELYEKMFANYPDVLTVEDATKLLGFKSQTAVIRRVHQHRIRCLKVGRSFMIPKEYLIDYLLDDESYRILYRTAHYFFNKNSVLFLFTPKR